jgi:hypothetical protein
MVELKVRKSGKAVGVVPPKKVTSRLGTVDGASHPVAENQSGPRLHEADFEAKMDKAAGIIGRYRNTLRTLA